MNKWRRLERRKEERTFRAKQRQIRLLRRMQGTAAVAIGLAQLRMIAATPRSGPEKVAAMAKATLDTAKAVQSAMAQWPNWGR